MCLQVKWVPALMEALWGWQRERPHPSSPLLTRPHPQGCTDVFTRSGKHLHLPCFHQRTSQIWRAHCFGVRHSLRGFTAVVNLSRRSFKSFACFSLVTPRLCTLQDCWSFHFHKNLFLDLEPRYRNVNVWNLLISEGDDIQDIWCHRNIIF